MYGTLTGPVSRYFFFLGTTAICFLLGTLECLVDYDKTRVLLDFKTGIQIQFLSYWLDSLEGRSTRASVMHFHKQGPGGNIWTLTDWATLGPSHEALLHREYNCFLQLKPRVSITHKNVVAIIWNTSHRHLRVCIALKFLDTQNAFITWCLFVWYFIRGGGNQARVIWKRRWTAGWSNSKHGQKHIPWRTSTFKLGAGVFTQYYQFCTQSATLEHWALYTIFFIFVLLLPFCAP